MTNDVIYPIYWTKSLIKHVGIILPFFLRVLGRIKSFGSVNLGKFYGVTLNRGCFYLVPPIDHFIKVDLCKSKQISLKGY